MAGKLEKADHGAGCTWWPRWKAVGEMEACGCADGSAGGPLASATCSWTRCLRRCITIAAVTMDISSPAAAAHPIAMPTILPVLSCFEAARGLAVVPCLTFVMSIAPNGPFGSKIDWMPLLVCRCHQVTIQSVQVLVIWQYMGSWRKMH